MKATYAVTFTTSQPSLAIDVMTVPFAANLGKESLPVPTLEVWTFSGWFVGEEAKEACDFSRSVAGDLTLYAGYTKNGDAKPAKDPDAAKPAQTGDASAPTIAAAGTVGTAAIAVCAVASRCRKSE